MEKFKRVFVVVMDSLGVGAMPDSANFGNGESDSAQAGGSGRESYGILWKAEGEEPWQGYHDRTLGDDGSGGKEAVPDFH